MLFRNSKSIVVYVLSVFLLLIAFPVSGKDVPEQVLHAARNGFQAFLNQIPAGERQAFGFAGDDDLASAGLGTPYRLYTIVPENLINFQAGTPFSSILDDTDIWYFPVVLDNKTKSILVIDYLDGEWQAVSLGLGILAKRIEEIESRWPAEKGYSVKIVQIFQANRYLVFIPEVSPTDVLLLPGRDTSSEKSFGNLEMEDSFRVFTRLKPAVLDNVSNSIP